MLAHTQSRSYTVFCCPFLPIENFYAGVSKIYGPRNLSLDAFCCTWRTWVFAIPIEEEGISLLNGPSGSERVPTSFFCISQRRLKYFSNPANLSISKFLTFIKYRYFLVFLNNWRMIDNSSIFSPSKIFPRMVLLLNKLLKVDL